MGKNDWQKEIVRRFNDQIPSFTDVFDEDTFYLAAFLFVLGTLVVAFILSRFVTIHPVSD